MHVQLIDALAPHCENIAEYHVRLFRGRQGLEQLAVDWDLLANRLSPLRFFHHVDWYRCYLDALEPEPDRAYFCAVYRGDQVEAIFPLRRVLRRAWGIRVASLELPYHAHMPLGDFILADPGQSERHVRALLGRLDECRELQWDRISLPRVLAGAHGPLALASRTELISTYDHVGHSDYFEAGSYEETFRRFSGNFRKNLRKARKRLAAVRSARFTSTTTLPDLKLACDEFLDLEASGWKGREGTRTAIKLDPRLTAFYRQLASRFGSWGGCEIRFLRLGDETVAAQFVLAVGDTLYQLKVAYDEAQAQLAPGNLLQEHLLEECEHRQGTRAVSLVSDSPWHDKFHPLRCKVYALHVYKPTLRGRLAWSYDRLQWRARSFAYARIRPIYRKLRGKLIEH